MSAERTEASACDFAIGRRVTGITRTMWSNREGQSFFLSHASIQTGIAEHLCYKQQSTLPIVALTTSENGNSFNIHIVDHNLFIKHQPS